MIKCPKCNKECDGEDLGDNASYLSCECECGFLFSYDDMAGKYYSEGYIFERISNREWDFQNN